MSTSGTTAKELKVEIALERLYAVPALHSLFDAGAAGRSWTPKSNAPVLDTTELSQCSPRRWGIATISVLVAIIVAACNESENIALPVNLSGPAPEIS